MSIEKLEVILRSLGWVPIEDNRSITWRYWKRAYDDRPIPDCIAVPRSHHVAAPEAMRILTKARDVPRR